MEFGGIFIILFISSGLPSVAGSVSGLDIRNGTFQILQQHPQLKKCTESVLFENEYVGCRVNESTGQCQALTHSWVMNQTIEQGYAYAAKLCLQENFIPPLTQELRYGRGGLRWKIPVVLNTGSQIDIFMSIPNWALFKAVYEHFSPEVFVLELFNGSDDFSYSKHHWLNIRIFRDYTEIYERDGSDGGVTALGHTRSNRVLSTLANPKEMFKISILVQSNTLAIFIEDEEVATLKLSTHIRTMRQIGYVQSNGIVAVHGIKFRGVSE